MVRLKSCAVLWLVISMSVPQVAIIGRPNVGKSSLLNWLARRRLAIVDDQAGVTRDRVTTMLEHRDRYFELVDTGGMGFQDPDELTDDIQRQIDAAIDSADLILWIVDARSGLMPLDELVAQRLRGVDRPVIMVVNKVDHEGLDPVADEFRVLGRGLLIRVSTIQQRGREDLLDLIVERLPETARQAPEEPRMKIAIVGRRNVGKSTFVNTLAKAERMIVSEVPGTTRDSVDVHFDLDGHRFIAIDTPGLRRNKSVRTDLEFYSTHRAQRSVRRADVVLMFFDASEPISKVDKQLIGYIGDNYRPCVWVVNKWDKLATQIPTERWVTYLRQTFPSLVHTPIAFITGQTGKNVKALLNHSQMLYKQANSRLSTGELNRIIQHALIEHPPPAFQTKRPRIYFATQVAVTPPTIVLKVNYPEAFSEDYRRFLLRQLRDHGPFGEVPIRLFIDQRTRSEAGGATAGSRRSRSSNDPDTAITDDAEAYDDEMQAGGFDDGDMDDGDMDDVQMNIGDMDDGDMDDGDMDDGDMDDGDMDDGDMDEGDMDDVQINGGDTDDAQVEGGDESFENDRPSETERI
jgi:GTPase